MADSTFLLENWSAHSNSSQQNNKISYFISKIIQTKSKWMKSFQQSIELWINFMVLRTQCAIQQYNLRCKNNVTQNVKFTDIQQEIIGTVSQTELSVLKALNNIEKLYMIPQMRQKSAHQSKQFQRKIRSKSRTSQKNRSSSVTSSFTRSRKTSLFGATTKPVTSNTFGTNNFHVSSDNFNRFIKQNNCHITKHQKQKPKYSKGFDDFKPNIRSTLPCESKINPSTVSVNIQNRSAQDYFLDKSKNKQKLITEKVSSKFEEKLKNIQEDLSSKLNKIISSLQQNKSIMKPQQSVEIKNQYKQNTRNLNQEQHHKNNFSQFQDQTQKEKRILKDKQNNMTLQKKTFSSLPLKNKQTIKRNSVMKKCTPNPIKQQSFQEIQYEYQTKLSQPPKTQNQREKNKNNNVLNFKQNIVTVQRDLKQFIISITKFKLPNYQTLVNFFGTQYINLCGTNKIPIDMQNIGLQNSQLKQIPLEQGKLVLKQFLDRLKKVVKIGDPKFNSKVEMMRLFAVKCVKCGYALVLNQQYELKDQINVEIEQVMEKL